MILSAVQLSGKVVDIDDFGLRVVLMILQTIEYANRLLRMPFRNTASYPIRHPFEDHVRLHLPCKRHRTETLASDRASYTPPG